MQDVGTEVEQHGFRVKEIPFRTTTYSNGPINPILAKPGMVKGKDIYLFQRLLDPFSEKPDHYLAQMVLRGVIKDRMTELDIGYLIDDLLSPHLRKYARTDGRLKQEYLKLIVEEARRVKDSNVSPSDIDRQPHIHHNLEGLIRGMIHLMGYIPQTEEATATAEGLMQYGADSITLVVPYLEGRSDRYGYHGEVNLSAKWAKDFRVHGIKGIITWRAHSTRQMEFYREQRIRFTQVYESQNQRERLAQATVKYLLQNFGPDKIVKYLVVVGPDKGSEVEAIQFGTELERILKVCIPDAVSREYNVPVVIMKKDRGRRISEIKTMIVERYINIAPKTDLSDRLIIFRDDNIDTVGTNDRALRLLGLLPEEGYRKRGQGSAILVVDNPVLSTPATKTLKAIKNSGAINVLIAPRTIEPPIREDQFQDMIEYLSIAEPFAAEIIKNLRR